MEFLAIRNRTHLNLPSVHFQHFFQKSSTDIHHDTFNLDIEQKACNRRRAAGSSGQSILLLLVVSRSFPLTYGISQMRRVLVNLSQTTVSDIRRTRLNAKHQMNMKIIENMFLIVSAFLIMEFFCAS